VEEVRINEDRIQEDRSQEDRIQEERIQEDRIQEDKIKEDRIKEERIKEDTFKEDTIKEDRTKGNRSKLEVKARDRKTLMLNHLSTSLDPLQLLNQPSTDSCPLLKPVRARMLSTELLARLYLGRPLSRSKVEGTGLQPKVCSQE